MMIKLPVIVGMGGINAAGRTSGFHSYKRMVCDVLSDHDMANTWSDLAHRMGMDHKAGISEATIHDIKQGTLVRRIDNFDPDHVRCHHKARLDSSVLPASLVIKKAKLPGHLAKASQMMELDNKEVGV
ncbi:MAG TPA: beta-ketoacyl synthase, partial [Legionella sp.]|nr:beta-ketoacyl synthase [Legionella sp.]